MHEIEHVNEEAELYALGALGALDAARVERHLRTCDACARRVGDAEATVLQLIDDRAGDDRSPAARARLVFTKPRPRIAATVAAAAIAAALTFGLTTLFAPTRERSPNVAERPALEAMLAGHFLHAPFVARAPGAPMAKVIYAREGGWIYVIAAPGKDALDVVVTGAGHRTPIASLAPSNSVRSSFAAPAGRADSVELVDRGATIATAHLAYPRR